MKSQLSRRDFLRAAGLLPVGMGLSPLLSGARVLPQSPGTHQNVLVLVFDAFSANHIPFMGYGRNTTPSLERLAERAIVYHSHYAGGNFTTPGTASLLTGTLPWTHRAFNLNSEVAVAYAEKSIFSAFPDHFRIAYSHNPIANVFLRQFSPQIDEYVPWSRLMLTADTFIDSTFRADEDIAGVGWIRSAKRELEGYSYSLFFSHLYQWYIRNKVAAVAPNFPRGIPEIKGDNYYLLSDAMDWLEQKVGQLAEPSFGYFHFMPPHAPYAAEKVFYRRFFDDGFIPPFKPEHIFTSHLTTSELHRKRAEYDEFILNVDRDLTRLVDALEAAGRLDNTWLVITSDHGELFERGFKGHGSPLLYEGGVRVPLLIFEPGRTSRLDIHEPTSAVDVLPTLAYLGGGTTPEWSDMSARMRPPGEVASYSNYNAMLAGYIVARVSGQPYDQYIQEHILDPLGMAHSTAQWSAPPELRAHASVGYTYADGAFQVSPEYIAQPALMPSGGHQASATDMARFMIAHLQDGFYGDASSEVRILKQATAQQMHTTQYTPDPRFNGIAYGFFDYSYNGVRTIGHRGYFTPMNSLLLLLPDQRLGLFVVYNSAGGENVADPHDGFQKAFYDHYFPAPAVEPIQPAGGVAERAGKFAGSYRQTSFPSGSFLKVAGLMDAMKAEISDSGDGALLLTYDSYLFAGREWRFVEVEPLYFRQVDGPSAIIFREDDARTARGGVRRERAG